MVHVGDGEHAVVGLAVVGVKGSVGTQTLLEVVEVFHGNVGQVQLVEDDVEEASRLCGRLALGDGRAGGG